MRNLRTRSLLRPLTSVRLRSLVWSEISPKKSSGGGRQNLLSPFFTSRDFGQIIQGGIIVAA